MSATRPRDAKEAPHPPRPAGRASPPPEWDSAFRERIHDIIFEHDTPAERTFDGVVIAAILLSVLVVMLDSVQWIAASYGRALYWAEWGFTILFTLEYAVRLWVVRRPRQYALSYYGLVDLLAILPSYIGLFFPPGRYLVVVRVLRVLRIFRVLRLASFIGEAGVLGRALYASRFKIIFFVTTVAALVVIIGSLMYVIEGPASGFTSIPTGIYWAVVTLSTVGYGDIAPRTGLGKAFASLVMIIGYGIIAVPTGIVTVELANAARGTTAITAGRRCPGCGAEGHDADAAFCKRCGAQL